MIRFKNTTREGSIPFGATFGLNNAVELPVPVDTRTTDVQTALEWANGKSHAAHSAGTARHSTTTSSMRGLGQPDSLTVPTSAGAPSQGRMASWPGNTLTYLHGTGAISLPARSRLTGYVAFGQGRNNRDLLPFTINTAIVTSRAVSSDRTGRDAR